MAHRYSTRSTTPMPIIDLTHETPPRRPRGRPPKANRSTEAQITTHRHQDEITNIEVNLENRSHPPQGVQQSNATNDMGLPCLMDSFSGAAEVLSCPICFEALTSKREPMVTRCGHIFCTLCLATSLKKHSVCPKCQSATKLSKCFRVYLS